MSRGLRKTTIASEPKKTVDTPLMRSVFVIESPRRDIIGSAAISIRGIPSISTSTVPTVRRNRERFLDYLDNLAIHDGFRKKSADIYICRGCITGHTVCY